MHVKFHVKLVTDEKQRQIKTYIPQNAKYVVLNVEFLVVLFPYCFQIFILLHNSLEIGLFYALACDYSMPLRNNKYVFI
jgi:hypothetical protein